jgi:hypothetical protein
MCVQRPSDVTLEPLHDYVDDDHVSLVSTPALRRVLKYDADEVTTNEETAPDTGFNPYDSG